ncbi:hypothetical protein EYF80_025534 [Liparis tanakae]|uniref:Uncharacterized protein n=1 Tax=Liparis tanakae TaxID=230148 RepID=A0A4Z2HH47_9TELE|nr:hypothetical protein EYF80_025534 [Liparis tanakae]
MEQNRSFKCSVTPPSYKVMVIASVSAPSAEERPMNNTIWINTGGDNSLGLSLTQDSTYEFAHEVSKLPGPQQDVAGAEGDHDQTHDEVGDRQRGDEEVGDCLEPLEPQDGGDHQHVTWTE